MFIIYERWSTLKMSKERSKKMYAHGMASVAPLLKKLRLTAVPAISMRQTAEKLGIGHTSYGLYENENSYKKPYLPIDLARRLALIFADHGIDPADVMKLAGLTDTEAEPEARAIEAARPAVQYFTVQAVMPSEGALAAMFETLLALIPADASRAEAARILAQQLPTGFGAIGPAVIEERMGVTPPAVSPLPTDATDDRGQRPPSRN